VQRSLWNGFTQAPKTAASPAPIPVNAQLKAALEAHRQRMGDWARDGFSVFQTEVHTPMNLANLVKRTIVPARTPNDERAHNSGRVYQINS
jgi:hypothetical protein